MLILFYRKRFIESTVIVLGGNFNIFLFLLDLKKYIFYFDLVFIV